MQFSSAPRILYVDDYQNCCDLISTLLCIEKCNYNFSIADTPSEALKLIAGKPFNLYILENKLPKMSGIELCRQIRKIDKNTPILFFSKKANFFELNASIEAGANEYLEKTQNFNRITRTIRQLLTERTTSATQTSQPTVFQNNYF